MAPSNAFSFNAGFATLSQNEGYSTDGVDYDASLDFSNPFAFARWHPFKGSFNFATGVVFTDNQVSLLGSPQNGTTIDIGGISYPADQVGTLQGNVMWESSAAPYFGIGWAKNLKSEGFGMYIDLGVMDTGSAQAALTASGLIASDPTFQQQLRQEEQEVNDELDAFDLFPVLKIGFMYRF